MNDRMNRIIMDGRKMGEESGGKNKWKENMYWSRFQTVQFFRSLTGDFRLHLVIPEKFVKNLREKLAGDVTLRGPSGAVWIVGMTTFDNTWYFKNGWREFVEDHSLEENDVLIFKYTGNSLFDVVMFDHGSLCEKEGAYFVERCVAVKKRKINEDKMKSAPTAPPPRPMVEVSNESSGRQPLQTNVDKRRKENRAGFKGSTRRRSSGWGQEFLSSRRESRVSDEEKHALEAARAHAAEYEASFVVTMRPSHVHSGFHLTIPAEWARQHLKCRRSQYEYVILQVGGKKWWLPLYRRQDGHCGLARGWKEFATQNYLQESDVLAFNLVARTDDITTLNVRIFRVVEDINIEQGTTVAAVSPPPRRVS